MAVKAAEVFPPVPPLVEVTFPVMLLIVPPAVAVTLTDMVHVPLAGAEPPLRLIVVAPAPVVKVPPQVFVAPGVLATCMPVGNGSLTATPVSAVLLGLVIVRVRVEVPPTTIVVGLKALAIDGLARTANVALAVRPVPPLVELTAPVVLRNDPAGVAVTLTDMAQLRLPLPVTEPPVRLIEVSPAVAVNVPPQLLVAPGVLATCMPVGNGSLTATPVSVVPLLGLVIVRVRVEVPPAGIDVGLKALVIVGAAMTVKVAEPVPPVPPLVEVTARVVLVFEPPVVAVTLTDTAQLLLALIEPPVRLIDPSPAFGEKVPPVQVFVALGVLATCKPLGNVSLTATPVSPVLALGLVIVRVRVEAPPVGIVVGLKALVIVGFARTVKMA